MGVPKPLPPSLIVPSHILTYCVPAAQIPGPPIGDGDYMAAMSLLVMPVAREFNPDIIIVSAGFDGVQSDPVGE